MAQQKVAAVHIWLDSAAAHHHGVEKMYSVSLMSAEPDQIACVGGNESLSEAWEIGLKHAERLGVPCVEYDNELSQETNRWEPDPPSKDKVESWRTEASYVVLGNDGEAYDGSVKIGEHRIGECRSGWFVRTEDTGDGPDEADSTDYGSRLEAEIAARELAEKLDEGEGAKSAEEYERRRVDDAAAVAFETDEGQFCVYWRSTDEYDGPRQRYATLEDAKAVAAKSQREFEQYHPGGSALCRFEVRVLADNGEWVECRGGQ